MGQKMIDPQTGLELDILEPAPTIFSADSVRGRMLANDPTQGGAAAGSNPFLESMEATAGPATPDTHAAAQAVGFPTQDQRVMGGGSGGTLRPSSLLDKVLFTLTGTPDSKMTPEQEREKHAQRDSAAAMSKSAAERPGEQFMGIPSVGGGSSLGEALGFLPGLIKGLGGLL